MIKLRSGRLVTLKLVGSVRIIIIVPGPALLFLTDATSNSRCGASHGGAGGCRPPPMKTAAGVAGVWAESVATRAIGTMASRHRMANLALLTLFDVCRATMDGQFSAGRLARSMTISSTGPRVDIHVDDEREAIFEQRPQHRSRLFRRSAVRRSCRNVESSVLIQSGPPTT